MTLPLLVGREEFLIAIYLLLALSTWSTTLVGVLRDLSSHGKTFEAKTISPLEIPKKWFLHFYVVGIVSSLVVAVVRNKSTRLDVMPLILLQVSRRCYECLYVHAWRADSKMHVPAYVVGLLHYTLLPWNIVMIDAPTTTQQQQQHYDILLRITGIALCLYAQYEQHMHHCLMANLRLSQSKNSVQYVLPTGRWFDVIGSPQYLTEIIIYIGFLFMIQTRGAAALLFWVASNQVLCAWRTHEWYLTHFDDYKKQKRKALIPYLF